MAFVKTDWVSKGPGGSSFSPTMTAYGRIHHCLGAMVVPDNLTSCVLSVYINGTDYSKIWWTDSTYAQLERTAASKSNANTFWSQQLRPKACDSLRLGNTSWCSQPILHGNLQWQMPFWQAHKLLEQISIFQNCSNNPRHRRFHWGSSGHCSFLKTTAYSERLQTISHHIRHSKIAWSPRIFSFSSLRNRCMAPCINVF